RSSAGSSTTSRSTGSGCRRGGPTRSPRTAGSSCGRSASASDARSGQCQRRSLPAERRSDESAAQPSVGPAEEGAHRAEVAHEVVAAGEVGAAVALGQGEERLEERGNGVRGHAEQCLEADPPYAVHGDGARGPHAASGGTHPAGGQRV